MKIKRTHIPFWPRVRVSGEEVETELMDEVKKRAAQYKKHAHDFSAQFELVPDPRGEKFGHFLVSKVTYERGDLSKVVTKKVK